MLKLFAALINISPKLELTLKQKALKSIRDLRGMLLQTNRVYGF